MTTKIYLRTGTDMYQEREILLTTENERFGSSADLGLTLRDRIRAECERFNRGLSTQAELQAWFEANTTFRFYDGVDGWPKGVAANGAVISFRIRDGRWVCSYTPSARIERQKVRRESREAFDAYLSMEDGGKNK